MNAYRVAYWFLFAFVSLLGVGCGPNQEAVAVTVENQVVAAVRGTLTAVPTYTPYPTQTAYPTHTPYPTATNNPTYTPYPTYTPVPSFTPTATFTPEPSATATVIPVLTRGESVSSGGAVAPSGDIRTQLLAEIDKTRTEIEEYSWIITPRVVFSEGHVAGTNANIDCQAAVSSFDSITSILFLDVIAGDPEIQNAYNLYTTAVNQFDAIASPWLNSCRDSLANGQAFEEIGKFNSEDTRIKIEVEATNLLRQAFNILNEQ